jgi:DNA-binding NarL/FixJ family response regulator
MSLNSEVLSLSGRLDARAGLRVEVDAQAPASTPMPTPMRRVRVALAVEAIHTRTRMARALAADPGVDVKLTASQARDAVEGLQRIVVDVLVLDLSLPDRSCVDLIRECRRLQPLMSVLAVSHGGHEDLVMRAMSAGARGCVMLDESVDDLGRCVRQLHAGGSPLSPTLARRLIDEVWPERAGPASAAQRSKVLTQSETNVLSLMSRGFSYAEIAGLSGVSVTTVATHTRKIYMKLDVHSKTEALHEARQIGLI